MFWTKSPADVRKAKLAEAELNLISHTEEAEYQAAMVTVLRQRVGRLRAEVQADVNAAKVEAEAAQARQDKLVRAVGA